MHVPASECGPVKLLGAVFSCLAWGLLWAGVALVNRVGRVALTVDAQGRIVTVSAP